MTQDTTLAGIIRRQGRSRPGETAFVTPSRTWTFAEADAESSRAARGLAALGIGPGDRVACLTKHTAEFAVLALGAGKLGAVSMPVNWRLAGPEIEYIVNNGGASFFMADEAFLPVVEKIRLPSVRKTVATHGAPGLESFAAWRAGFDASDPGHEADPDDTGLQLYSSGTTGLPKGVEISCAGLMEALRVYAGIVDFGDASVMLNALPSFHIAGVCNVFMPLRQGGRTVFHPEFEPGQVIETIGRERISHTFLVPAMILFMLQAPAAAHGDYSSLQVICYGGSPAAETLLAEAGRTFKCRLFQVYGMTEGPVHTCLLPQDHDPGGARAHLLRSAGTPAPGVQLRIVDPATGRDVAEGAGGEIWVRSRQLLKGYWHNPQATAQALQPGAGGPWLRTGDAGYLREGYLYIHDRIKDMIISGGENIYPAEVENVLAQHPAVAECAVIGVPDEKWGESVKACVVLRPGAQATEGEIVGFTRERLAHYKCPKSVDFVAQLPRNPSGKLLKRILREPYWEGRERHVG